MWTPERVTPFTDPANSLLLANILTLEHPMRAIPLILSLILASPAFAALAPGAKAPNFTTQGALAGKSFNVTLSSLLKKGPVVLYPTFPK